jgi:V/A-type H+-transporting ATPase subunit I
VAIIKMQKVALAVYKKELDPVLASLQDFGNFQVNKAENPEIKAIAQELAVDQDSQVDLKLADLEFLIRNLTPFTDDSKKSFQEKFIGASVFGTESEVIEKAANFDFAPLTKRVSSIEEEINQDQLKISKIEEELRVLSVWSNLDFPLRFDRESESAVLRVGQIENRYLQDFETKIAEHSLVNVDQVNSGKEKTALLITYHKTAAADVESILELYRFEEAKFSEFERTSKEQIRIFEQEKKQLLKNINSLEQELRKIAQKLDQLKFAYDYYLWQSDQEKARKRAVSSSTVVFLEGWVVINKLSILEAKLGEITNNYVLIPLEVEDQKSAPVEIANGSNVSAFESVTRLYGLPLANEIDPTPYLAPFFALFFGFCLTDAGYGLLLTISSLVALKFLPLKSGVRGMVKLMVMCGLATILMGMLFGGWFGIDPEKFRNFAGQIGEALTFQVGGEYRFLGQIVNPMEELTTKVMYMAFGLGFLHLLVGVILSGVIRIQNNQKGEAFNKSFYLAFILVYSLFAGLSGTLGWFSAGVIEIINIVWALLGVYLVWAMGYGASKFYLRPFMGLIGIFNEAIAWLSNILSYSRLFALGLATGIVALIFNDLALQFGSMFDSVILSILIGVVIILFGHSVNFGLNLLGAFIHSARLQFVEFFGKFLEAGGKQFEPLKRKHKYLFDQSN